LEGLEVSEVLLSELRNGDQTFRIDSEYNLKVYLSLDKALLKYGGKTLATISKQITDFGAYSQTNFIELKEKGIKFIRNQDEELIILILISVCV
jgi:hypothetical protein